MNYIHHPLTSTSNPDKTGSFYRLLEVLKPTKFATAAINTLCHPSRPTVFLTTWILGGHVTSRNQGLSLNDRDRQGRESLGTMLRIQR